jgi:hypothetical protein
MKDHLRGQEELELIDPLGTLSPTRTRVSVCGHFREEYQSNREREREREVRGRIEYDRDRREENIWVYLLKYLDAGWLVTIWSLMYDPGVCMQNLQISRNYLFAPDTSPYFLTSSIKFCELN